MFSSMQRSLKSIDFYQAVPSDISEGTLSGACISVVAIALLIWLTTITIYNSFQAQTGSDLIVDHEHLDQKLKVNIDISFPSYPCSMLSLDVENILKVHEVNLGKTLYKYNLPEGDQYLETDDYQQQKRRMAAGFAAKKGCRMRGWFQIDRVPGNFHFSCHAYSSAMQDFLQEGGYRDAHRNIDLTHKVNELWFGESKGMFSDTLSGFQSHKEIGEQFLGISYTYFLDIIESNEFDSSSGVSRDYYYYTVRMNEVIMNSFPLVYFKYETNPITVLTYSEYSQWHEMFVKIVGIIGGIFTVATILDGMVHSSIRFLLDKQRLNKLR